MSIDPFHARHAGLLDPAILDEKRALLIGAGSVGSVFAELLARAGVRRFSILDKDNVETSNLCRTVYGHADIGRPKVEALRDRLDAIRPGLTVDAVQVDMEDVDDDDFCDQIVQADIIIAVTDHPPTQLRTAALSYPLKPAIFAGVYEKGIGGEVIFTLPEETACYACILGELAKGGSPSRGTLAYGMTPGEMMAEPALGTDIAHVTVCAAKIALGVLLRGTEAPAARIIDPTRNLLLVGNSAEWVWKDPFETDWVRTTRRETCLCRGGSTASLISMDPNDDIG